MASSDIVLDDDHVSIINRVDVATERDGDTKVQLHPDSATARLGTRGTRAELDGGEATLKLGANGLVYGEGYRGTDVKLAANSASLRLGGGEGEFSEGDLRLADKENNVRVHASAGKGAFDPETTRALIDGDSGVLKLGSKALEDEDGTDISDVKIHPKWAALTLGGGGGSNSDGDIKLQDRDDETRIHLDGGGGGPAAPETTSLHVDGETGSLRFRPPVTDSGQVAPMFYMYSGPSGTGGPRDWTREDFPTHRPIAVVSPFNSNTGLFWTKDYKFTVEGVFPGETPVPDLGPFGHDAGSVPSGDLEVHQPLTVDVAQNRVGVRTNEPQEALDVNGNVTANNLESVSDARCKQNVEPVSDGLKTVQNLRGVSFEWDDESAPDREFDDERHLGFVAQELARELPEAVSTREDGVQTTVQDAVTPVLVEAIKEQQELIERQRELLDRQRDTMEELEGRVDRLEPDDTVSESSEGAESGSDGANG